MNTYWTYILDGLALGVGLAILMGPIFVALVQTSIEQGGRAGMTVGTGIWISDIIIVTITFIFVNKISDIIHDGTFQYWMGMLGGFVLILFGVSAMVKNVELSFEKQSFSAKNYLGFLMKGFLVNTINPFTFVFWISVISTYIIGKKATTDEIWIFLSTILITIMITDSLKVVLAKFLKEKLNEATVQWIIRIAGFALLIFGIALIYRVH